MANDSSNKFKVLLHRTEKELSSVEYTPEYGEPLFWKDNYLIVGPPESSKKELTGMKRFKAVDPSIVDNSVYFETQSAVSSVCKLTTDTPTDIYISSDYVKDSSGISIESKLSSILEESKSYTDTKALAAESAAKSYADTKSTSAENNAKSYSKKYTDEAHYAGASVSGGAATTVMLSDATVDTSKHYVACVSGLGAQSLNRSTGIYIKTDSNVLMGAAWNDIAEYRRGQGKPGQCVCEDINGNCIMSTKRLQKNPNIISDTFGFAIGETSEEFVPLAIAGTVLAYTDTDRDKFKPGDVVCSGRFGTVSKMSRLEIILFPDRILGTVCRIPVADTWNNDIKINNRIWIKL